MKRFLLFLTLLSFAISARAQTVAQGVNSSAGAATFTSNVTAGNAFVAFVLDYLDSGTPSVFGGSDNNSNSWVQAGTVQSDSTIFGNAGMAIWYACNIAATPNAKPTVMITDTKGTPHFRLVELSGVASSCFDQFGSNTAITGSTTVPWNSGTITPTVMNSIVMGFSYSACTAAAYTAGGWIQITMPGLLAGPDYKVVTSNATISPQFICGSGTNAKSLGTAANFKSGTQPNTKKIHVMLSRYQPHKRSIPVLTARAP